jgi:peptide/nickel transport system permease protein
MTRYALRRLLAIVPVIVGTSIIVFVVMRLLPGDPILVIAGRTQAELSAEVITRLRQENDLDKPIYVQYVNWVSHMASGDFGRSIHTGQPVAAMIGQRLLPTAQIGLMAWLLALCVGLPVALMSATSPNSWKDWIGTVGALVGAAMPYFLLGGGFIYLVALRLRLLPASGYISPIEDPLQSLKVTLMPALTVGLGLAAITARQARSSLVEVLQQPYVTTARAKGVGEVGVILRHALKNGLLPVVTLLGIQLGNVFGGAVITETIFAVPGTGRLLVESIFSRDYVVVQALVLLISVVVVLANVVVDLVYGYLDPRIRLS